MRRKYARTGLYVGRGAQGQNDLRMSRSGAFDLWGVMAYINTKIGYIMRGEQMSHRHDARSEELRIAIDNLCVEDTKRIHNGKLRPYYTVFRPLSRKQKSEMKKLVKERWILCRNRFADIVKTYGHPLLKKKRVLP